MVAYFLFPNVLSRQNSDAFLRQNCSREGQITCDRRQNLQYLRPCTYHVHKILLTFCRLYMLSSSRNNVQHCTKSWNAVHSMLPMVLRFSAIRGAMQFRTAQWKASYRLTQLRTVQCSITTHFRQRKDLAKWFCKGHSWNALQWCALSYHDMHACMSRKCHAFGHVTPTPSDLPQRYLCFGVLLRFLLFCIVNHQSRSDGPFTSACKSICWIGCFLKPWFTIQWETQRGEWDVCYTFNVNVSIVYTMFYAPYLWTLPDIENCGYPK